MERVGRWNTAMAAYWARNRLIRHLGPTRGIMPVGQSTRSSNLIEENLDDLVQVCLCPEKAKQIARITEIMEKIEEERGEYIPAWE
jgi:hypothetical protein